MSLVECRECDNMVSTQAAACPHCGAVQNRTSYTIRALLWTGVVVVLVLPILVGLISQFSRWVPLNGSGPPAGASTPAKAPLELISWRCDRESGGWLYVRGEVRNVSGERLQNVTAVGEFRTEKGDLVSAETALVEFNPLMPGQTSPFRVSYRGNPEAKRCGVSFKRLMGGALDFTGPKGKQK